MGKNTTYGYLESKNYIMLYNILTLRNVWVSLYAKLMYPSYSDIE